MDIPQIFNIPKVLTASITRSHPKARYSRRGAASGNGTRVLDSAAVRGDAVHLGTRLRSHRTGIDMSQLFTSKRNSALRTRRRRSSQVHPWRCCGYVSDEKVGVAACVGATWIAGVSSHISSFWRGACARGIILIGEPYWRQLPRRKICQGCLANSISDFLMLPELLASFGHLGYDVVEMVLADKMAGTDTSGQMLTMRRMA